MQQLLRDRSGVIALVRSLGSAALRRLHPTQRTPRGAGSVAAAPVDPGTPIHARVHAALRPRGLVEINGVVRPAWWSGPGAGPGRAALVLVTASADRLTATSVVEEAR